MKELKEIIEWDGTVKMSLVGFFKCLWGNHYWMCHSPTDNTGRYVDFPQVWTCRRQCWAHKKTLHIFCRDKDATAPKN